MSQPTTIETAHSALGEQIHAEAIKRGAAPFARYADDAYAAVCGIETVIGLLRRDTSNRETDDGVPVLSAHNIEGLLGLAQFASKTLREDMDDLRDWGDQHFVREGE